MAEALEALLQEGRTFPPPDAFRQRRTRHRRVRVRRRPSATGRALGRRQALALDWIDEWHTILEWDLPFAKWFVGGRLNVAYNCLDRHVDGRPRRPGRVPLGRRARRHPRRHVRRAPRRVVPRREPAASRSASPRATASRSTWAWCPSCRPRCSRARASARRTRSCSAASPRVAARPHQRRARPRS